MEIFKIVVLSLSGLLLVYAGLLRLIKPLKSVCLKFYLDHPEIKLEAEVDIFSEMRGAGVATLFAGIIILLGTILPQFRLTSFVVGVFFFLGFAIGRLVGLGLDGKPNKDIVAGTITEIVFSALNISCLVHILI